MKHFIQLPDNAVWGKWQKIGFRFFLIFLSLQVLTESFLGNLFEPGSRIWKWGESIFVAPCLWLNNHIFHFKYEPESWTTFSATLHTIRDIVYFAIACVVCIIWTLVDRGRNNYNRLNYWFCRALIAGLFCIMYAYGIAKLFPLQMSSPSFIDLYKPIGDYVPYQLLFATIGYGTPYEIFSGLCEVLGAILIIFPKTRVTGLLVIICTMLNVLVMNYAFIIGVFFLSFYILVIALYLLAPYLNQLFRFFILKKPTVLYQHEHVPTRNFKTRLFRLILLVFMGSSFFLNTRYTADLYARVKKINSTRRYSLIKSYIVDNDTLKLIDKDTIRWRLWSERISNGKRFVTIVPMNPNGLKTYRIDQDSNMHTITLYPLNPKDTNSLTFNYTDVNEKDWRLEGIYKQENMKVELQRVNPDTTMALLKPKRAIWVFNDEENGE